MHVKLIEREGSKTLSKSGDSMELLSATSDLWREVTFRAYGEDRKFDLRLALTYGFDPKERKMAIVIEAFRATDPKLPEQFTTWSVKRDEANPALVYVFVTNIMTAQQLATQMGFPQLASTIRGYLDEMAHGLDPFVEDVFLGRTCEPDHTPSVPKQTVPAPMPQPDKPKDNILVVVERDVSPVFRRERCSCVLKYTLFSEPKAFRAVVTATALERQTGKVSTKIVEFVRKEVQSIMRDLENDWTAYQFAAFFGDTDSRRIAAISTVLQLGFMMGTKQAMEAAGRTLGPEETVAIATVRTPESETITLPVMEPIKMSPTDPAKRKFTVYSGLDGYFEVPETT
jgi:hypothetical protein